jgi:hypothetical protein
MLLHVEINIAFFILNSCEAAYAPPLYQKTLDPVDDKTHHSSRLHYPRTRLRKVLCVIAVRIATFTPSLSIVPYQHGQVRRHSAQTD